MRNQAKTPSKQSTKAVKSLVQLLKAYALGYMGIMDVKEEFGMRFNLGTVDDM